MAKRKTLEHYISHGTHEFVAFVKSDCDPKSLGTKINGNKLGKNIFGVMVCKGEDELGNTTANFYHRSTSLYKEDSDIMFGDFGYTALVDSENPLAVTVSFRNHYHLKKGSEGVKEAEKILARHGF